LISDRSIDILMIVYIKPYGWHYSSLGRINRQVVTTQSISNSSSLRCAKVSEIIQHVIVRLNRPLDCFRIRIGASVLRQNLGDVIQVRMRSLIERRIVQSRDVIG